MEAAGASMAACCFSSFFLPKPNRGSLRFLGSFSSVIEDVVLLVPACRKSWRWRSDISGVEELCGEMERFADVFGSNGCCITGSRAA